MANEQDVRELLSLQQEIDGVASEMSGMMTNDASVFTFKKSAVSLYFAAEDACNTEMEKFEQALKQELLSGSNANDKSLLYLRSVSTTAIAAVYRGHLGRKMFAYRRTVWMEERRVAAARKIQKWLHMVSGMRLARGRRQDIEMEWKSAAATQIQRIYKGRYQTNAVRGVQASVRNADFQFHLTRGAAYEALSKAPENGAPRSSSRVAGSSDTDTSSSDGGDDDVAVGAAGWLPGGVRRNIHDETFRES
jgi:hypothetical protein